MKVGSSSARLLLSASLTAPRHIHDAYASFITRNSSSVSQIESALRSLAYLLPSAGQSGANAAERPISRIRALLSTELAPELVHSLTQLLSLYHNDILRRSLTVLSPSRQPKPLPHTRYTKYWTQCSPLYTRLATMLQCIQYTELLWEMVAKRRGGEKSRWRIIVLLESMKAIIRLALMRLTNGRRVLNPPLPEREEPLPVSEELEGISKEELLAAEFPEWNEQKRPDRYPVENGHLEGNGYAIPNGGADKHSLTTGSPPISLATSSSEFSTPATASVSQSYQMPRTSLTLEPLPDAPNSVSSYLLSHVIDPTEIKPAQQLLSTLSSSTSQIAEILYILRPVLYALILQRLTSKYGIQKARRDWRPWLLGVLIEYTSFRLSSLAEAGSSSSFSTLGQSAVESDEVRKRQMAAFWWLLRGAAWEGLTKRWVSGVSGRLKRWPLLDLIGGVVEEYEYLWGEYYFATANA